MDKFVLPEGGGGGGGGILSPICKLKTLKIKVDNIRRPKLDFASQFLSPPAYCFYTFFGV
jgi:hypothetical protein